MPAKIFSSILVPKILEYNPPSVTSDLAIVLRRFTIQQLPAVKILCADHKCLPGLVIYLGIRKSQ